MDGWWNRFLEWLFREEAAVPHPDDSGHQHAPEWARAMHWELTQKLAEVLDSLHSVHHKLRILGYGEQEIMTAVQVEQEDLDAVAADLTAVGNTITQEIADLEAKVAAGTPLKAGDLSGLKAAQAALDALAVPAATPPADGGDTPPADGGDTPPADGGDTPVDPPADGGDTPADPADPVADPDA